MVTEDTFAHEWHSLSEEEKEKRRILVKTHVKSLYPVPSNPNDREISAMDEEKVRGAQHVLLTENALHHQPIEQVVKNKFSK